jgi:hypothetical protein
LHKLHLLPSQFLQLPQKERAFIIAAIQSKMEKEKKENKKAKRGWGKKKGR